MIKVRVLVVLGFVLLGISATTFANHFFGHSRVGVVLSDAPLPRGVAVPTATMNSSPTHTSVPARLGVPAKVGVPARVGVPVRVIVDSHGVSSSVSADKHNADGSLFVPADPHKVSWAREEAAPGSARGTIVLIGHVNFNGVQGAFSDLPTYKIGQGISLVMADGRTLKYAVAAKPIEVNKRDVAGARLAELFDQKQGYGLGDVKSSRLLLLTCGGVFDNRTGHYESNVFVYALPI